MALTPPPIKDPLGTRQWLDWFLRINVEIEDLQSVAWSDIVFGGSNITDIVTRNHNSLTTINGGTSNEYYHLTSAQHTEVTGFFAATNITGAEAETLTNTSNADALHTHKDLSASSSVKFKSYTVAGLPSASTEGAGSMIYVSNEAGGAVMAYSDGTNWLRVTDRAVVS